MNVVFHAGDFFNLLLITHVVVDESKAAVECHLDRHLRFGHGIHVGRDDGNLQFQRIGNTSRKIGLSRQHIRVERGERDVVVG